VNWYKDVILFFPAIVVKKSIAPRNILGETMEMQAENNVGLHEGYPILLSDFNKTGMCRQFLV
jgi:hypothetical protein